MHQSINPSTQQQPNPRQQSSFFHWVRIHRKYLSALQTARLAQRSVSISLEAFNEQLGVCPMENLCRNPPRPLSINTAFGTLCDRRCRSRTKNLDW
jgi:hypothetical protein